MGISIICTHPKYEFDMGYMGFFNLRKNIALALDKEFGTAYASLATAWNEEKSKAVNAELNRILSCKTLDEDIVEFLYMSDCGGKISYRTCKKIYDVIKDVDFGDKCFRYGIKVHNDYEEFKEFLKDCYRYHKNMEWY